MVSSSIPSIKEYSKGITLVEIIVVIFLIGMFSMIFISDFPKMLRQFALSRATYKLGQDLRKTQDLGLSGIQLKDRDGLLIKTKGYGVYMALGNSKKYVIYADVAGVPDLNGIRTSDQRYSGDSLYPLCSDAYQGGSYDGINPLTPLPSDCVIEVIDISEENASLSINNVKGTRITLGSLVDITSGVSINFVPPNPTTKMQDNSWVYSDVIVTLKNTDGTARTVKINTSGLIDVQ